MFGPVGAPGQRKGDEPAAVSSTTPTERLAVAKATPATAAPLPATPAPLAPLPPALAPLPPAPAPAPARPAAPLSEAELLKQRVLEHTAKLRRSLLGEPEKPAPAPAPSSPPPAAQVAFPAAAPEAAKDPAAASPDDTAALRRAIADRTRATTLQALEKKGVRNVKVLDMKTIEKIVGEAVERALDRMSRHLSAGAKKHLEQEAKREFLELMDEHKRTLSEKSDEERRRLDLEKTVEKLRSELAVQQDALTVERETQGVTISPESLAELEAAVGSKLREFMTDERRLQVAGADPKLELGLNELEKKLAEAFDRLIGRVKSAHEDVLERRIDKLNKALAATEDALRRVASMKHLDDGIASIYDSVQGLSDEALNFARKKELLAVVFLENLEIQKKEVTDADRASAVIKSPLDSAPKWGAQDGFEPPMEPLTTETAF
jgi:hypothetical protein